MRQASITIDALIRCHGFNVGEALQLDEWVRRFPDLLVAAPGVLYLDPAMVCARKIRGGWLPDLQEAAARTALSL